MAKPLNQIGGWLKFYIVMILIFTPLAVIFYYAQGDKIISEILQTGLIEDSESIRSFVTARQITGIINSVASFISAIFLMNKYRNAIELTKGVLILSAVVGVLDSLVFPKIFFSQWQLDTESIVGLVIGLGITAAWYGYFTQSKRVAVIYGGRPLNDETLPA